MGEKDGTSGYAAVGGYTVSEGYEDYLSRLLDAHEADNVMAQIKKYELVKGDVVQTMDQYLTTTRRRSSRSLILIWRSTNLPKNVWKRSSRIWRVAVCWRWMNCFRRTSRARP